MNQLSTLLLLSLIFMHPFAYCEEEDEPRISPATARQNTVAGSRPVMGWLETVFLEPWHRRVTAKLDSGAKTSSLHADNVEHFTRNSRPWVRFSLVDIESRQLPTVVVERELVRTALIKSHQNESSKRDVVMMTVCKNGKDYEEEFNLVDRSHFNYPVLLGRGFLKDLALVDANSTFVFSGDADPCALRNATPP
jgi:hypothetical protein